MKQISRRLKIYFFIIKKKIAFSLNERPEWAISFIAFWGVLYSFLNTDRPWLAYPIGYFFLLLTLLPLQSVRKIRPIYKAFWIPVFVVFLFTPVYMPMVIWLISQSLFIVLIFGVVAKGIEFFGFGSNVELLLYLSITISAILLTTLGNLVYQMYPFSKLNKEHAVIGMKLHSQKRTKIYIYIVYFILLSTSMVCKLVKYHLFLDKNIQEVLIQSFATYLAFDRIHNSVKDISFKERANVIWKEYLEIINKNHWIV